LNFAIALTVINLHYWHDIGIKEIKIGIMTPTVYLSKITGRKMVRTNHLTGTAFNLSELEDIRTMAVSRYRNSMQKELLESCKTGDPKAQLQIYKQYYKIMFNISLNIVNDREKAEEIMQESFLLAFEKIYSFSGRTSFIKWLIMMVQDLSIESWRRQNIPGPDLPLPIAIGTIESTD
jgi:hypothetical protein